MKKSLINKKVGLYALVVLLGIAVLFGVLLAGETNSTYAKTSESFFTMDCRISEEKLLYDTLNRYRSEGFSVYTNSEDNNSWIYDDEFAGLWLDEQDRINVGVTGNSRQTSRDPQVVYHKREFSLNFLNEIRSAVSEMMPKFSVFGVGITPQYNRVRVSLTNENYKWNILNYLEKRGIFASGAIDFSVENKPTLVSNPIRGGLNINRIGSSGTITAKAICNRTGRKGIITNAHVAPANSVMRHGIPSMGGITVGTSYAPMAHFGGLKDIAFVPFDNEDYWQFDSSAAHRNSPVSNEITVVPTTYQVSSRDEIQVVGRSVAKFGDTTGRTDGRITMFGAEVLVGEIRFTDQIRTSVNGYRGDSGSPLFITSGDRYILAGVVFAAIISEERPGVPGPVIANKITNIACAENGIDVTIVTVPTIETRVVSSDPNNRTAAIVRANRPLLSRFQIPASVIIDGYPHTVVAIDEGAFTEETVPSTITVPATVTYIGSNAVPGNTIITWEGRYRIRGNVFLRYLGNDTSFTVPTVIAGRTITRIGQSAFPYPLNLITLPSTISEVWHDAFHQNTRVVWQGRYEFRGAQFLRYLGNETSFRVPLNIGGRRINTIVPNAFAGSNIRYLELSLGISNVGISEDAFYNAFSGMIHLQSITVPPRSLHFSSIDGVLFYRQQTTLIRFPAGKSLQYPFEFHIPSTVTEIAPFAFQDAIFVNTFHIHSNVEAVGIDAFTNLTSNQSIFLEADFAPDGWHPWWYDGSAWVAFGNNFNFFPPIQLAPWFTQIHGDEPFATYVSRPTLILNVSNDAIILFENWNLPTGFDSRGRPISICENNIGLVPPGPFFRVDWGRVLIVPHAQQESFRRQSLLADNVFEFEQAGATIPTRFVLSLDDIEEGSGYILSIDPLGGTNSYDINIFSSTGNFPNFMKRVENGFSVSEGSLFSSSKIVFWVDVPANTTGQFRLTVSPPPLIFEVLCSISRTVQVSNTIDTLNGHIEIPDTISINGLAHIVTSIGPSAFQDRDITSVRIPSSVRYIQSSAFHNTKSLEVVIFDENSELEFIGWSAFALSNLREITIPKSIEIIANGAFSSTFSLEELFFEAGSNLSYIGERAFWNTSLPEIVIPASVQTIARLAFLDASMLYSVEFE